MQKNTGLRIQSDESFYGKGAKRKIPEAALLAEHLIRKSLAMFDLHQKLEDELKTNEQYELFTELEMPLSLILADMESCRDQSGEGTLA